MTRIFLSRHQELAKIQRYKCYNQPLFYRTNVSTHTKRIVVITEEICRILKSLGYDIDIEHTLKLAEVHDDEEIVTGDIVSPLKEKFTKEQREEFDKKCLNAIDDLVTAYGSLFEKGEYKNLLQEEVEGKTGSYFIMKYADKLEQNMEISHELFGGNKSIIRLKDESLEIDVNSYDFSLASAQKALNNLCLFFKIERESLTNFDIFHIFETINDQDIVAKGKPHTPESLKQKTGYKPYDKRKELLLQYLPEEEKKKLRTQIEF